MILCGVDETEEAAQAARFAGEIAVRLDGRLVLLHAAPEPWVPPASADHPERMQEQQAFDRAGYLGTVVNPIPVDPRVDVVRMVEFGRPDEVLRAVADDLDATHLVVGSRRQGAVQEALGAGTGGALARDAPCPVILVPRSPAGAVDASADPVILCGVDGSDGSLAAVRAAAGLAGALEARLVLATVVERDGDGLSAAAADDARAAVGGLPSTFETRRGRAAEELLALARSMDVGLVAVGSRGRGALTAALLGSVSTEVVQASDRPVMVVPPRAAGRS